MKIKENVLNMFLFEKFNDFTYHLKPVHGWLALLDGVIVLDACAMHFLDQTHRSILCILIKILLSFHLELSLV